MTYRTESGASYSFSYQELREHYLRLVSLPDVEFLQALPEALHLACIVSWFKELPADATLGDEGIVHELVHLLPGSSGTTRTLGEVRGLFERLLALA